MTAAVSLYGVWLNDAVDPSDAMGFDITGQDVKVTSSGSVEARAMAGGRQRLVSRAGTSWSATTVLPWCSPAQVAWLRAHEGRIVCLRDPAGTKLYGFYAEVPVTESTMTTVRDHGDVELSFTGCSFSEAV
jgi:hypothetical protein